MQAAFDWFVVYTANVARAIARCWGRQRVIDFVFTPEAAEEHCWTPQPKQKSAYPSWFLSWGNQFIPARAKDKIMEQMPNLASFHPFAGVCIEFPIVDT